MPPKPKVSNFPGVMLAHSWTPKIDPTGWLMSEKLDGVRAIWNGEALVTRGAIKIPAPEWFTKTLPTGHVLDGELWMGRGKFQQCSGAVRRESNSDDWKNIVYHVFDCMTGNYRSAPYIDRFKAAHGLIRHNTLCRIVAQTPIESLKHMEDTFANVVENGGEGLIIRLANGTWIPSRAHTLLKVKADDETDAVVAGYLSGEGKHKGRVGALICKLRQIGKQHIVVHVGTGLTDAERDNAPAIGTVIRVGHSGVTDAGVPRFPRFNGVRAEQGVTLGN
jgi:DNA ligase-1